MRPLASLKLLSSLTGTILNKKQVFVCGGVQQLLNKQSLDNDNHSNRTTDEKSTVHILDLPDEVYLHLFSYLNPLDLCQMSNVCKFWYRLATDDHLWNKRLTRDAKKWSQMSSKSNPDLFDLVKSDRSKKEIYLSCSPDFRRCTNQIDDSMNYLFKLSDYFKGLLFSPPSLIMFGPGLESKTSPLVQNLLWDESKTFQTMGMIPGQAGFGSGIKIKLGNHLFNLITLYTNCMKERENRSSTSKPTNHLISDKYEVNPQVRDICRDASGLIYVVDASTNQNQNPMCDHQPELQLIMKEQWMNPNLPLLILSCVIDENSAITRLPAIDVVRDLNLTSLANPWLVQDCCVDNMKGFETGFSWLLTTRNYLSWIKNENNN